MSKMIQIRNVPDHLHAELKARAARAGRTLSDYLLAELERVVARPSPEEFLERLRSRSTIRFSVDPVDIIRAERDRR